MSEVFNEDRGQCDSCGGKGRVGGFLGFWTRPCPVCAAANREIEAPGDSDDEASESASTIADVMNQIYGPERTAVDKTEQFADQVTAAYAQARSSGDPEPVVELLKEFLVPRMRTLFTEDPHLARAARSLVDAEEFPEIREWAVDLLGRTCAAKDISTIVGLANNDDNPRVRQEATAALGKFLRFRDPGQDVKKKIRFTRKEDDEKVRNARAMVKELL